MDNCIMSVGMAVGRKIIQIPLDKLANREYSVSDNRGELVRVNNPSKPKTSLLLSRVSGLLAEQDIQAYVVGGFVRDLLLERDTADIDIAVASDALEVAPRVAAALGGKYVPLDKVNRIGRVVLLGKGAALGEECWELDFSTFEGSIEQDLARRDFTIDAMAIDLSHLVSEPDKIPLVDPFDGLDDLHHNVIRATTNTSFEADAARLLRAVRLAAELDFNIDEGTEVLIQRGSHLVAGVAGERVREELLRILAISGSKLILPYLDELGLLTAVITELAGTKGIEQPSEHFWNVFDHSLQTVVAVDYLLRQGSWEYANDEVLAIVPWLPELAHHFELEVSSGSTRRQLLKLAALLHDVAKPQTKATISEGKTRFLGHAQEGASIVVNILERLRFSAKEVKLVEALVRHHLRPVQISHDELPTNRAVYRYFRDTGDTGIDILFLSMADHLATRGPNLNPDNWREHVRVVEYVLAQRFQEKNVMTVPKLVDGHDLINIFGLSPGSRIGWLLEAVREAQVTGEITSKEEALTYIRKHLLSEVT